MDATAAPFDVEAFNADIRAWGHATLGALKAGAAPIGARGTGQLMRLLKVRYYQRYGEIYGLGYQFPRYGVWLEKGARKGYGGSKGSRWWSPNALRVAKNGSVSKGNWRKTDPTSFGKMNTGASKAFHWFNPVVDARIEVLADMVARHYSNMAVNAILIR